MKLTEKALSALKNFSSINESLYVRKGNKQSTIDTDEAIIAEIELPDSFPKDFGIYDLSMFLSNFTTLNNPELTFDEKFLTMNDGTIALRFFYCSPNLLKTPPEEALTLDNPDVSFSLPQDKFQKLMKISTLNSLSTLTVIGENQKLTLQTHEAADDTSNVAKIELGDYTGDDFKVSFNTENLKMIPDDYNVGVNLEGFALFENVSKTTKYFIATQTKEK